MKLATKLNSSNVVRNCKDSDTSGFVGVLFVPLPVMRAVHDSETRFTQFKMNKLQLVTSRPRWWQ